MLQAIQLTCARQQKPLFVDLSFQVNDGGLLLIEGPNGSGKSSLLRLLAGLSTPNAGEIHWQGKCIQSDRVTFLESLHFLGHLNGIKLGLTVAENLSLTSHLNLLTDMPAMADTLDALQLSDALHKPANELSAGQKRRIALAKLILFPKKLWLLDEPLTALDVGTQHYFNAQLKQHLDRGGIAIISSHHELTLQHATQQTIRLPSC